VEQSVTGSSKAIMKNITPEDAKSGLRKTIKVSPIVHPPKEMLEEARETVSLPKPEKRSIPSGFLLAKWAEQREVDNLEDLQQNIMKVQNWKAGLADDFLDAWWLINPGLYNQYHHDFKGIGHLMISELKSTSEGTFNFIWGCMVESLIEQLNPRRP